MPYVITTYNEQRDGVPMEDQTHADMDGTTRRAVATLDAAREAAASVASTAYSDEQIASHASEGTVAPLIDAAWELPEQGGTVGPLPDGTVIEVEHVPFENMVLKDASYPSDRMITEADLIAAYNEAQS